ncbi:MAG: gamma-glutamyltransferase, partial [Planctomycetota bacterium]
MPRTGWGPVTVPGAVAGWAALHARGASLPFERLIEPAIRAAREGFPVSPITADAWARSVEKFRGFPSWMATFAPNGRAPAVGEIVRLPDHARSLQSIAHSKGESMYRGELA